MSYLKKDYMKKTLILLLLSCSVFYAYSQPSGYLGKRNNVSYSSFVFVPIAQIALGNDVGFINYTHSFNFERTISKNKSLGFRYQRFSSAVNIEGEVQEFLRTDDEFYNYYSYNSYYGSGNKYDKINEKFNLNVSVFAFDYIFYNSGWIAPLGPYKKVSMLFVHYSSSNFLHDNKYLINQEKEVSDHSFAFTYTMGKRWIFKDRFTFHAAGQLGFYLPLSVLLDVHEPSFRNSSDIRLFTFMQFNFELGVGVLL
jgi:hypothetical protein